MESLKKKVENSLDHLPIDCSIHPITLEILRGIGLLQLLAIIT
jgi:hypothetical protein